MSTRAEKYEALLDDLAPLVDGDPEALERHADFLADDDEARDLRHDAAAAAELLKRAGADYVPPADLEARLLAALDAQASGRTTSPGFAAPDELAKAQRVSGESPKAQEPAQDEPGQGQARGELGHAPTQPMPVTPAPVASDTAQPAAAAPKPAPKAEKRRKGNVVWLFPAAGIAAVAAAGLIGFALFGGETTTGGGTGGAGGGTVASAGGLSGTVEHVARAAEDGRTGIEIRRAGSDQFVSLAQGESVPNGAAIRTDDRTRARLGLSDGSTLVLNHATEVQLAGERAVQVRSGEVSADIAHLSDGPNATFETRNGTVEVLGTKFVLAATDDVTSVRVTRGVVSLRGASGEPARVHAGEEGLARPGAQPSVTPALDLAQSLSWSELTESVSQESEQALVGLGSLRARRPGEREARERPLSLARHTVRVRIVGNVARTEIEEVFRNDSNETLEGIYRFPLPADAQIARLALDVNGQMEEGSFVARDRAAAIWRGVIRNATPVSQRIQNEEFIWVPGPWTDPALLEWQRGGQFELRIFPIPAHGERRVILGYTQTVAPQAGGRRYVYPLAHSTDGSTEVGEFDVDVRVADAERVGTHGYPLEPGRDGEATTLRFRQQGFRPNGDLVVDYAQPGADRELSWWTYRGEAAIAPVENTRETDEAVLAEQRRLAGDGRGYVALALRPRLPAATMRRDRDYVVVIDSSQSMVGERFARANELASRVVGEMDRRDRFTMFACDHECRQLGGGMRTPGAEASREASDWLSRVEPAGASDLVASLREVAAAVSGERREERELHVIYVGDGMASVGYRRASSISAEIEALVERSRLSISTVGLGGDADTMVLAAMARAGHGHYVPYVPGQRTSAAALAVLETTYGASLEDPALTLPAGLSDVAPSRLPTIRNGQEVVVVARMDTETVNGEVVLRGSVAGRPFEQRYRVELVPSATAGNRFVPRLWAAGRIDEMQLAGRNEDTPKIVATSKAFGVMSRHTSLLVLESEAMFRAFRVDRAQNALTWTGEEDAEGGSANALAADPAALGHATPGGGASAGMGGLGTLGAGRGGGGGGGETRSSAGLMMDALAGDDEDGEERGRRASRGPMPPAPPASRPAMAAPEAAGAAPRTEAQREQAPDDRWRDMPAPAEPMQAQQPAVTAPPAPMPRPRMPGRWMRRVWVRTGSISTSADPSFQDLEAARRAERELEANRDSRDRHREAARRLSRAGQLQRALEVVDAWIARDRQDPEALTFKSDVLARMGRRDEALRLLSGTVDLSPDSVPLHDRLAQAYERGGQLERACAHRVALAEIDDDSPAIVGAALRCERSLGHDQAAARLSASVSDEGARSRAERVASTEDAARRFGGDFTIDATWSGGDAVDLAIITPQGSRLSWMGGRTGVVGEQATAEGRERLGLRWTSVGTYTIEINRTDPEPDRTIRGELRIRALGETRTVPFELRGEREAVAQVRVSRESRLEVVTGTVGPGW